MKNYETAPIETLQNMALQNEKELHNKAYLEKLERSFEQLRQEKIITKTMEELEAMAEE